MEKNEKKKNVSLRLLAAVLSVIMIFASLPMGAVAEDEDKEALTFATTAGLSYVSLDNRGGYNESFLLDARANGLQYAQLEGLLDSAFEALKVRAETQGLRYLLVDGNLTYNGEYFNAMAVAQRLKELEAETGVQVIVCNGPRDIYNISSSTFASGARTGAAYTSPSQFKDIFSDLGYDIATNTYRSSSQFYGNMSYSVELEGGYRLIVIDASHFDPNGIMYGAGDTSVTGSVSDDLLEWIETECYIGKLSGQTVIGMCGWDLSGGAVTGSDFVLDNGDSVANALADAGMSYIYTAGSGKNDVSALVSDNGNVLHCIQTAGLLSFPNTMRVSTFTGETASLELIDVDEAKAVESYNGTVYETPYRETASLKIQYADYDMARYYADIVENYMNTVLIPGVEKNGTLEGFVTAQYGFSLKDRINESIGGGLNILDILVFFDASNIMNMLEDMFVQATASLLKDPKTLSDLCYARFKEIGDTVISSYPSTAFASTYGFGSGEGGGTVNDLLLSAAVYSKMGNENSSEDAFVTDISARFKTGELVTVFAKLLGTSLIKNLLFEDIFSEIELKPQYLLFLDDTEESLGYYLQVGFRLYLALHGEDPSVTGAVKSILSDGILSQYGRSIDEVIDYFIAYYYSGDDGVKTGEQLSSILDSYVVDTDPKEMGDWNTTYDGTQHAVSYASRENFRLPTMINLTAGEDASTGAYITWYTKSTVTGSDIELYTDKNAEFYGNHFIGAEGVSATKITEDVSRTEYMLDLGFASFGESQLRLTKHTVVLSGLVPGCTYFIRVGDAAKKWWSDTISLTAADGGDSVSFIHVTDTAGRTKADFSVLDNILACADYLYPDTDFILHTGNFVSDDTDTRQWQYLLDGVSEQLMSELIVPVSSDTEGLAAIRNNFSIADLMNETEERGAYYSFDYNNIHIAVLDSGDIQSDGTLSEAQLQWFREDMSQTTADWNFVAIHSPVYSNGLSLGEDTYTGYRTQLDSLMSEYDVDLVFTGGDGVYYRTDAMDGGTVSDAPRVSYPHYSDSTLYYKTIVNPTGTVYSALGSSGAGYSDTHEIHSVSNAFEESGRAINPELPMFTAVEIREKTLYLTTYTLDGQRATRVDSVSIIKGTLLQGDANGDGQITAADARLVLRASAGLEMMTTARERQCDMNGDGKTNSADARLILRTSAGLA